MKSFLIRWLITAASLAVASWLLGGVWVDNWKTLLLAALLLGAVNAVVRPVLFVLTLPVTVVTLGLFLLVLNAAMLGLVAWILPGFGIDGFFSALLCWIVVSLVSAFGNHLVHLEE